MTMIVPTASLRAWRDPVSPHEENGTTQIVSLNAAQIASMDPNCSKNGTCPWGARLWIPTRSRCSTNYPLPNGYSAGDGLNTASYTWSAPAPASLNTFIAKVDYSLSSKNWLFLRGNLQNDSLQGAPQFPADSRPVPATAITARESRRDSLSNDIAELDEYHSLRLQLYPPELRQLRNRAGFVREFLWHEQLAG